MICFNCKVSLVTWKASYCRVYLLCICTLCMSICFVFFFRPKICDNSFPLGVHIHQSHKHIFTQNSAWIVLFYLFCIYFFSWHVIKWSQNLCFWCLVTAKQNESTIDYYWSTVIIIISSLYIPQILSRMPEHIHIPTKNNIWCLFPIDKKQTNKKTNIVWDYPHFH